MTSSCTQPSSGDVINILKYATCTNTEINACVTDCNSFASSQLISCDSRLTENMRDLATCDASLAALGLTNQELAAKIDSLTTQLNTANQALAIKTSQYNTCATDLSTCNVNLTNKTTAYNTCTSSLTAVRTRLSTCNACAFRRCAGKCPAV